VQQLSERDLTDRLGALKIESERQLTHDAREALRLAEALVDQATRADRADYRALGLMAKGDALRNLGRHREALELLEAAGVEFLVLGDEVGWARTRLGWVWSLHQLSQGATALDAAGAAHALLVGHAEWLLAAGLDLNTAFVCSELGRNDEALRLLDRALALYERAGQADPGLRADVAIRSAKARANKARILTLLGGFDEGIRLFEEARDSFEQHGETVSAVRAERFIASVYAGQGHYTRALRVYSRVHRLVMQAGLADIAVEVRLCMVECYMGLNRHAEALGLAEEAATQSEAAGTSIGTARCQLYAARAHASLAHRAQATALLDTAAATFARAGLSTELGIATLERAREFLKDAHWLPAAEEADRARMLFAERGLPVHQAQAELVQAWAALGLGQDQAAAKLARSALQVSADRRVWPLSHAAHHILARAAERSPGPDGGDAHTALDEYDQSIADLERVQGTLVTELRVEFLGDKLQVYEDAIECALRLGQPEKAFGYLERAKSRALVDYLAVNPEIRRGRASRSPAVTTELARLRDEHNWFYNRLNGYSLAEPAATQMPDAEIELLRAAVAKSERGIRALLEHAALDQPGLEELDGQRPNRSYGLPTPTAGTVLVEYFLRADDGVAFVVAGGELTVVPIGLGVRGMRRLLNRWELCLRTAGKAFEQQEPLDALNTNARGLLQVLYRALIQPLEHQLAGCERLIIIPFGPLHAVPFHALHDGERYLLERYEVSACPSSSILQLCAERHPPVDGGCVTVAYSNGGRLPRVVEEARTVADLLGGACYSEAEATRARVMAVASGQRVVHLAAHAAARLDNPGFAHVTLADGQLSMVDVCNLDLDGALVTLSACETGRSEVLGGDEVVGLSRGFLYAGASTLIQSLWRVEDDTTAELMRRFYTELGGGCAPAAALRSAQRALLEAGAQFFVWAPFQLLGSSGE
jgi:tetratricopeptide (TPR) repeat protein